VAGSLAKSGVLTNIYALPLYARVSTSGKDSLDKARKPQDAGMQLRELREYARHRGWKITEEYVDRGVSGAKESRPTLTRLLADALRRKCDAVLVWRFDLFRPVGVAPDPRARSLSSSRHRFRIIERVDRHQHSHWQNDFHRPRRGGGARAVADSGARKGRAAKRPRYPYKVFAEGIGTVSACDRNEQDRQSRAAVVWQRTCSLQCESLPLPFKEVTAGCSR